MSQKRSKQSRVDTEKDQQGTNKERSEKDKDHEHVEEPVVVAPPRARARRSSRPSKNDPLIPYNTTLHSKYRLLEVIGAGGYGQIFKAIWAQKQVFVAVKVMTKKHEPQRMILEQRILHMLQNRPNFPHLYGSGTYEDSTRTSMFIVMELLGRSLSDLRKKSEGKHFDPPTAIRVGMQGLDALKALHELGYVHRDIKPGNMCTGYAPAAYKNIFVVDFGLSRKYKVNGKVLRRNHAGFRGTMRYVSLNVHERKDQGRGDDLISLFYAIIELSDGSLPWTRLRDGDDIARKKKMSHAPELCRHQPEELFEFYSYCYETYEEPDSPAYDQLSDILKRCLPSNFDMNSPMSYEAILMQETIALGSAEPTYGDEQPA